MKAVTQTHRGGVAALIAAGLAVLLLAACSARTDAGAPVTASSTANARIPAEFDTTFRWVPGQVFDLGGSEGTFVRAFVESFELANAGRSVTWGYPGFADAAPSNIDQMVTAYPSAVSAQRPGVGTVFFTGLRRVDDGERTRIVLCRYGYRSIRENDATWSSTLDEVRPVEIDIRRVGATPPAGMHGTQRTPDGDVFGGWYVSRFDFAAIYPTPTADENACAASTPEGLVRRTPTHGHAPWPVMAPSPGWSGVKVV